MVERNRVHFEHQLIEKLLQHPQDIEIINLQTYGAEQNEAGDWVPNIEGVAAIIAVVTLYKKLIENETNGHNTFRIPPIVISGGHANSFGGKTLSEIYSAALQKTLEQLSTIHYSVVIDTELSHLLDHKQIHILAEHSLQQNLKRRLLAVDTLGTITFLDAVRRKIGFKWALSIGRIGHLERIQTLANRNHIPTEQLSIEGILFYFYPKIVDQLLSNPQVKPIQKYIWESETNFAKVESRNRKILHIDRLGILTELAARLLGHKKTLFTHRERH